MFSVREAAEGLANRYLPGVPSIFDVNFLSAGIEEALFLLGVSRSADMDYFGKNRKDYCEIDDAVDGLCEKYFPGTSSLYEAGVLGSKIEELIVLLGGSANARWNI